MSLVSAPGAGRASCRQHSLYPVRAGKLAWRLVTSRVLALEERPARSGNRSRRTGTSDEVPDTDTSRWHLPAGLQVHAQITSSIWHV